MTEEFFRLTPRSATRDFWFHPVVLEGVDEDLMWARRLEKSGDFIRRVQAYASGPLRFEPAPQHYGKRMNDLLWCTGGDYHLASDRFVGALRSVEATGFSTYPVDFRDHAGDPIPGYVGLVVTGECGDVLSTFDDDAVYETSDSLSGYAARGINPRRAGWDGSDLFTVRGVPMWSFMVTARVLDALRAEGATDLEIEPSSQVVEEVDGADLDAWLARTRG